MVGFKSFSSGCISSRTRQFFEVNAGGLGGPENTDNEDRNLPTFLLA
jgi:hypothetical protein